MLTVKQVKYTGEENIFEASAVKFIQEDVSRECNGYPCVRITLPGASAGIEIADGICYVMNEAGSTIAKYRLFGAGAEVSRE